MIMSMTSLDGRQRAGWCLPVVCTMEPRLLNRARQGQLIGRNDNSDGSCSCSRGLSLELLGALAPLKLVPEL